MKRIGPEGSRNRRGLFRNADGSVAVEFAVISIPLFGLIYGIIELGLMYFVSAILDHATDVLAREIRTGHAYASSMSHDDARAVLCDSLLHLFGCRDELVVFVTSEADIADLSSTEPISDGRLNTEVVHDIGRAKDFVMVQAYLPWNSLYNTLGSASNRLSDGRYVLGASFLFRNEPFE